MAAIDYYKILGLHPGAGEAEVKHAYRTLAKKYHPDKNPSPGAAKKFIDITKAYESIIAHPGVPYRRDPSYDRAEEIIREERQKARERARKAHEKKREEQERFRKSYVYDLLLLLHYAGRGILVLVSAAAIVTPVLLAVFIQPVLLAATFYFMILGGFLLWHIHGKRKTWFRLGKFNLTWERILASFKQPVPHFATDYCYYAKNRMANGRSYEIKLIKVVDIKVSSSGVLDHQAKFSQKARKLVIPRSTKAEFYHRISSLLKVSLILASILFFPVSSVFWRFVAGILLAMTISYITLKTAGVKSKTSHLATPALLIKSMVWIAVIFSISKFGPGFNLILNEYRMIVFAGLIFFLDMLFDLILGFFPFYKKLFRPLFRQRNVLDELYAEGYQNYIEYPVYSLLYPFIKWIF